ncbi:hypothetical protein L1049_004123 [Liquidambar formosana]|uniref:Uncharacterized protein n=1 Tax=Liquidambar formosana TaxID=63359 RepID=A0AAP0X0K4_LIQFO
MIIPVRCFTCGKLWRNLRPVDGAHGVTIRLKLLIKSSILPFSVHAPACNFVLSSLEQSWFMDEPVAANAVFCFLYCQGLQLLLMVQLEPAGYG